MAPRKTQFSFEKVIVISQGGEVVASIRESIIQLGVEGADIETLSHIPEELEPSEHPRLMIAVLPLADETGLKFFIPLLSENPKLQLLLVLENDLPDYFHFLIATGQVDFCRAPVGGDYLRSRIEVMNNRARLADQKVEASDKDPLTDLLTRQAFISRINPIYSSAQRGQVDIAFAIISIEGLDAINKRFGQRVGDRVLKSFADILNTRLRDTDYACRYSGRCLALLTVNMRATHIDTYLDDLMLFFLSKGYQAGLVTLEVKASIGATQELGEDIDGMLAIAEKALEMARVQGDNVVTIQ